MKKALIWLAIGMGFLFVAACGSGDIVAHEQSQPQSSLSFNNSNGKLIYNPDHFAETGKMVIGLIDSNGVLGNVPLGDLRSAAWEDSLNGALVSGDFNKTTGLVIVSGVSSGMEGSIVFIGNDEKRYKIPTDYDFLACSGATVLPNGNLKLN